MMRFDRPGNVAIRTICAAGLLFALPASMPIAAQEEFAVLRRAAEQVAPSVVQIETIGGRERVGDLFIAAGPSTGVVVSDRGLIVTSLFSIVHEPTSILVRLPNGNRSPARIVSRDLARNLVLLECPDAAGLPVPIAAPESELQVGQFAVAVGRVHDAERINTSVGIVSALDRVWGKAIQTDAKISPSNYGGALVDLQGRVIGIPVPISPQSEEQLAGFEWYDSGIGFVIPFETILGHLDRWSVKDLRPGKLGVTPKASDNFTEPLEVAAVGRLSPAGVVGLMPGDRIVEIDGRPIRRFPDLKHALGRRYAGETIVGVIERQGERMSFETELAAEIEPFRVAALGIEPAAVSDPAEAGIAGVVVERIDDGGPVAALGINAGDRIVEIAGAAIASIDELATALAPFAPGENVEIGWTAAIDGPAGTIRRGTATLAPLAATLPPPPIETAEVIDPETSCELKELRLEQFPETCDVVVPNRFAPDGSFALVVVVGAPGKVDAEKLRERWGVAAVRDGLIVVAPHSTDERRWQRTDVERIATQIGQAIIDYGIDPRRVAIVGEGPGAALAALIATDASRTVRGLALIGSGLPPGVSLPENEPLRRLSIGLWLATDVADTDPVRQLVKANEERGIAIAAIPSPKPGEPETLREIGRWTQSLDRH
ncbi:MAG TPA: hypothetical protein DCQ98_05660 [Planctomycetaceae bacterium]|nr:hypothetical protein [Planctomycetaceae bacterium]